MAFLDTFVATDKSISNRRAQRAVETRLTKLLLPKVLIDVLATHGSRIPRSLHLRPKYLSVFLLLSQLGPLARKLVVDLSDCLLFDAYLLFGFDWPLPC